MTPTLPTFAGFVQIGYVTTDLTQAIKLFADQHNVQHWAELRDLTIEVQPGQNATLNIGLCWVGNVQLELIQPVSGATEVYREPLPAQGFAVRLHHLAQLIGTEAEFERQRNELQAQGQKLAINGAQAGGAVRYFYTDQRATLGHYIEHIYYSPEASQGMQQLPRN